MRPKDTSPAAYRIQLSVYRRMTADERLALALRMSDELQTVTADGVHARHPDYGPDAIDAALLRLRLGTMLFRAAYPERTLVAP